MKFHHARLQYARWRNRTSTDGRADTQTDPIAMVTFNRVVSELKLYRPSHSRLNLKPARALFAAQQRAINSWKPAETNRENNFHTTLNSNGKWFCLWWKCRYLARMRVLTWSDSCLSCQPLRNIILRLCGWIKLKTFRSWGLQQEAREAKFFFYQQIPRVGKTIIRRVLVLRRFYWTCVEILDCAGAAGACWIAAKGMRAIFPSAQDDEIKLSSSTIHHVQEFVVAWASSGEDCKAVSRTSSSRAGVLRIKQKPNNLYVSTVVHSKFDSVNLHSWWNGKIHFRLRSGLDARKHPVKLCERPVGDGKSFFLMELGTCLDSCFLFLMSPRPAPKAHFLFPSSRGKSLTRIQRRLLTTGMTTERLESWALSRLSLARGKEKGKKAICEMAEARLT